MAQPLAEEENNKPNTYDASGNVKPQTYVYCKGI